MLEERRDTMGGDFNYIVSKYTPFDKIIENLKKKYRVQSLTEEEIPNLAMHRFNTAHLPAIESLGLSEEQLQIKAIKIIIDEHSVIMCIKTMCRYLRIARKMIIYIWHMNLRLVTIIQIATNYFLRLRSPVVFF